MTAKAAGMAVLWGAMLAAAPAHATWRQATSRHFIVYSEEGAGELQKRAERLERDHPHAVDAVDLPGEREPLAVG